MLGMHYHYLQFIDRYTILQDHYTIVQKLLRIDVTRYKRRFDL